MAYDWAVIGAGPAGIAAVGKLLDQKIPAQQIVWIDPHFNVGDFGTRWRNVPSNTKVKTFLDFLSASPAFQYSKTANFALNTLDPEKTCRLGIMADALQAVSDHLKKTVKIVQDAAEVLTLKQKLWHINLNSTTLQARNVILAVGAEAKNLSYPNLINIPLHDAMDSERIQQHLQPDDKVAVFGSSHSAILALRNLVENNVKQIVNFYRSPLRYAVYLGDWILFDDTGLKGTTADWARDHIDGDLPSNLTRIYSNSENIEHHLPHCNKIVAAVGFERRLLPVIQDVGHFSYIEQCGIIAPGLFGLGIAFPEAKYNRFNVLEYRVGLWKFMDYLQNMLPIWMKYSV